MLVMLAGAMALPMQAVSLVRLMLMMLAGIHLSVATKAAAMLFRVGFMRCLTFKKPAASDQSLKLELRISFSSLSP